MSDSEIWATGRYLLYDSMKPTLSLFSFPFAPYTTEKCKIAKLPAIFYL